MRQLRARLRKWLAPVAHRKFKAVYGLTNTSIDSLGQHIWTSWSDGSLPSSGVIPDNDPDFPCEPTVHLHSPFPSHVNELISLCCQLSGRHRHDYVDSSLSSIHRDGRHIWKMLKSVRLPPTVPKYSSLIDKVLFDGDLVHGRKSLRLCLVTP